MTRNAARFRRGDRVVIRGHGHRRTRLVADAPPFADEPDTYGVVEGIDPDGGTLVVLTMNGTTLAPRSRVEHVTIETVELRLAGHDLVLLPELRRGLAAMWTAEAHLAGVHLDAVHPLGEGLRDSSEGYVLAEVVAGGAPFVVRAERHFDASGLVHVRAQRPNRWDG